MRKLWAAILFGLAAQAPQAQELTLLGGSMEARQTNEHSFAWSLDYQHRFGNHTGIGLTYLNEGHPGNHHRDGLATQLWLRSRAPDQGLSFAAGIGPYYFFDTTAPDPANPSLHQNVHGWGALGSLTANWEFPGHWFAQLRLNKVLASKGLDTNSVLLGVGYHLDNPMPRMAQGQWLANSPSSQEVALFAGRTIVNSLRSERSSAAGLEYRRAVGGYFDWTVSYLNEGDANLLRRSGVATQIWLVRPFKEGRIALGVGAGPYYALHKRDRIDGEDGGGDRLSGLISLTARYQLSEHWLARMTWHRVMSQYHRDTDVVLIGAGYTF